LIPLNDIVDQKFKFFETDWPIQSNITDGAYELRVKIQCNSALGGGITYSNIATGIINRTALQVFGVPEPQDGILNFGDEISVMFTDEVDCGQIATADISLMFADDSTFIPRDSILVDCMGNKIILKPMVPLRKMQGRYLVARVDRLFNSNGNPLLAPVEWTFKVNQNRLVWETSNTIATTYQGSKINVTGKLKNVGGSMESFTLRPTRSWLSPLTTSGTVPPSGDQTITFLVSDKLNPGEYTDTVYARTADGDEPFYVTVRVLYTPPDWTVDNSKYRYTMNFTTQFVIDSAYSSDAADIVAAFVGNECRGVANIQYIPSLDVYRAFLTVYSEDRGSETVRFRVWDASTGKVYSMKETYAFTRNASFGTLSLPVILHPDGVEQSIPLDRSWTWFSINKQAADMSPNAVLANTDAVKNNLLKSQTKYCQYSPGSGWVGSLDTMKIGEAYKIKLAGPSEVSYIGSQVPVTTPITYSAGWNWIGYLPNSILDINTALGSMIPSANDWIKSRDAFAQYSASGGWQGSMGTMDPGFGYMLNVASGGTLTYPDVGNLWPGRRSNVISATSFAKAAGTPAWSVDPSRYEHTMNLTGVLFVDGALAGDSANIIGAFVGQECRGIITPIRFRSDAMYFMTLYSNGGNEIITLKVYVASMDTVIEISEKMLFAPDVVLGSPDMPFALHANTVLSGIGDGVPTAFALKQNFPNPFGITSLSATDITSIWYSLPNPEFVTLKVFDVLGKEVAVLVNAFKPEGTYRVQFDASAFSGGVYTYQLKAGAHRATRTMVFLK
ncbi:MAG: T9SS type A sorting domain-containing protein, partial [Chlorobi bacterium]|nr:T9SS type A sorting domain-containing protein [Chlorobiota bacterium]